MSVDNALICGLLEGLGLTDISTESAIEGTQRKALPVYDTSRSPFRAWLLDLKEAFLAWPTWSRITMLDISGQHRRFLLGALWVPLGMALFVFALGYVYSYLRNLDPNVFVPYLAASMVLWTIIHTTIMRGMSVFVAAAKYIENVRLPFHYFVLKNIFETFYTGLLTVPVYFAALAIYKVELNWGWLMVFPALLVYLVTAFSVLIIVGLANLRIRDIQSPLGNFMRLMFLLTPIIWMVEGREGSKRAAFIDYNPFYHFIEIARAPLLGDAATMTNWIVALSLCAVLLFISSFLMIRWRAKIQYWV